MAESLNKVSLHKIVQCTKNRNDHRLLQYFTTKTVAQKICSQIIRKNILYKMKYMLTGMKMRATIKKIHVLDIVGGEYVNEEQRCSD